MLSSSESSGTARGITLPARLGRGRRRHRQRGVVAIEFALVFLFGVLPLLLLTLSGVLIFAAKQSLTLAAADGARAALRYGTTGLIAERSATACQVAQQDMQWLLNFSGNSGATCTASGIGSAIVISTPSCTAVQCIQVQTAFDYDTYPFIPGTATLYGWVLGTTINSSATVQLDD